MSITHHPSDETLVAFAAGSLDEPGAVVVAAHLFFCAECRRNQRLLEGIGGTLLERLEPSPISAEKLQGAIAQIGGIDVSPDMWAPEQNHAEDDADELSTLLAHYGMGRWRSIGAGVKMRSVNVAAEKGSRLFMLAAGPGTRLPHHLHSDREWTCVLQGAFSHELGRYGPGDFDEADETVEHHPVVEEGVRCVCLVAMKGDLLLQGWLGRLLQPFIRI